MQIQHPNAPFSKFDVVPKGNEMSGTSRRWKPEPDQDPRHRIGITLDRPAVIQRCFLAEMPDTKNVPPVKRRPGRPATILAVRDLRVTLSAEQDARFLAYRRHVEAQAPGFNPTDVSLARAIFLLGLEAFEARLPQLPLPLESSTTKT